MTLICSTGKHQPFQHPTETPGNIDQEATRSGKLCVRDLSSLITQQVDFRSIKVKTGTIEVPYLQVSDKEYDEAKAIVKKFKTATMEAGRDFTSEDIARKHPYVMKFFAQNLMDCRDKAIQTKRIEKMISIRFGDQIGIVSLPAEPFTEIGLAIKKASRFR